MIMTPPSVPARAVTRGPRQHFFGYYEKTPWDPSGRCLLALETAVADRPPGPGDTATVGLVDLADGDAFHPLAQTHAWNWQQGCMLQWLPGGPANRVIYNDREDGRFVSVLLDVHTGNRRTLPRPVYALSHSGRFALTLNFSRLYHCRSTTGYPGVSDPGADAPCPPDDGIYRMDLETGASRLIVSFAQIAAFRHDAGMDGAKHWFEHLLFSPDDTRFVFLHRWHPGGRGRFQTRMFTADPDGGGLHCVTDHEMVSHFDWKNPRQILAWARRHGVGDRYFLFTDRDPTVQIVGDGVLSRDGHCSFSPDGRWLLTDTYPDTGRLSALLLFRLRDGQCFEAGRFFSPSNLVGDIRCDLHPRWNRHGDQVCIDSAHEGQRQIYVLDVGEITRLP
jgi:hypothetical protein